MLKNGIESNANVSETNQNENDNLKTDTSNVVESSSPHTEVVPETNTSNKPILLAANIGEAMQQIMDYRKTGNEAAILELIKTSQVEIIPNGFAEILNTAQQERNILLQSMHLILVGFEGMAKTMMPDVIETKKMFEDEKGESKNPSVPEMFTMFGKLKAIKQHLSNINKSALKAIDLDALSEVMKQHDFDISTYKNAMQEYEAAFPNKTQA